MLKNIVKKGLVIAVIFLFIVVSFQPIIAKDTISPIKKSSMSVSSGNTLYVGGNGPDNYTRIQDAIDDASYGDTVFVYDDSSPYYIYGDIRINKSINLIGENKETTILNKWDEDGYDVIEISSDGVLISGFTIKKGMLGIFIKSNYSTILNNTISSNWHGIYLEYSNNNKIIGNNITSHNSSGIEVYNSSRNNTIRENNISSNGNSGIGCSYYCDNNTITDNIILKNRFGISICYSCDYNTVSGNIISQNNDYGVFLGYSICNTFQKNDILDNTIGIEIIKSNCSTFQKNNFIDNDKDIYFYILFLDILFKRNIWKNNYWNKSRNFPKLIPGSVYFLNSTKSFQWYQFDWHPAQEPYDIPTVV